MSRRKHLLARGSTGRLLRHDAGNTALLSPTEARRLFVLGRLYRDGKINSAQFAAASGGQKGRELLIACRSPSRQRITSLDAIRDMPIDPDTTTGAKEVARHEKASAAYIEGRQALRLAGRDAERVADEVCTQDRAPAGLSELNALRAGLAALAALWSAKRKASAR